MNFCIFEKYLLLFLNINYRKLYTDEAEWFEWFAKIPHSSLPYLYSTVKLLLLIVDFFPVFALEVRKYSIFSDAILVFEIPYLSLLPLCLSLHYQVSNNASLLKWPLSSSQNFLIFTWLHIWSSLSFAFPNCHCSDPQASTMFQFFCHSVSDFLLNHVLSVSPTARILLLNLFHR